MSDPEHPEHRTDGLDLARSIARGYQSIDGNGRPRARARKAAKPPVAPQTTGAHPDDRDPQTLDATLGRLVAENGWETDVAVHAMFGRWSSIVGPQVAQHCALERFADGKLHVSTDSTAWATQLRLLAPKVVATMNQTLGAGTVDAIVVSGPRGPSWKKGGRSVRGRGPRDTYG